MRAPPFCYETGPFKGTRRHVINRFSVSECFKTLAVVKIGQNDRFPNNIWLLYVSPERYNRNTAPLGWTNQRHNTPGDHVTLLRVKLSGSRDKLDYSFQAFLSDAVRKNVVSTSRLVTLLNYYWMTHSYCLSKAEIANLSGSHIAPIENTKNTKNFVAHKCMLKKTMTSHAIFHYLATSILI